MRDNTMATATLPRTNTDAVVARDTNGDTITWNRASTFNAWLVQPDGSLRLAETFNDYDVLTDEQAAVTAWGWLDSH